MATPEIIDMAVVQEIAAAQRRARGAQPLLDAFVADARRTLVRMAELARRGDVAAIAAEAHRLKGSSASVGATRLSAECRALEQAAREGTKNLVAQINFALGVLDSTQILFSCLTLGGKLESAG